MKKIIFAICIIALIASPAFAAEASNDTASDTGSGVTEEKAHSISIFDGTGGGGGVLNIKIANGSTAAYSGADGAGGLASTLGTGQVMCAVAASLRADPDIALYFGVRGSQDPAVSDDNNIYQLPVIKSSTTTAVLNSVCV
ncbi:MAG: hypothetical protein K8S18_09540, partial [Desulfobacula sp.]|nr:hypothetical protein [Desulfobacula sp.]